MPRNPEFLEKYFHQNILITKKKIKDSVSNDNYINQCINNIEEIDKAANILVKRLREWYELYNPEFSKSLSDHEKFTELVIKNKDPKIENSMGANLSNFDKKPLVNLAQNIFDLYELKKKQVDYLDQVFKKTCPNVFEITGSLIGSKLLEHAGSLKRLSMMTASTIQLLGAEKALFRHMKTGAKAPKHGLILNHPLLQKAKPKNRGKVARQFADKVSIAAKVDYFKGEFIGDKLRKELLDKFDLISKS